MPSESASLSFPFRRRYLRGMCFLAGILAVMMLPILCLWTSATFLNLPAIGLGWRLAFIPALYVGVMATAYMVRWLMHLLQCLKHNTPALLITDDGLVDNASGYWVGLMRWEQMQHIFPWKWEQQLFGLKLRSLPTLVIRVKDRHTFLASLPRWKSLMLRWERADRQTTFLVPEIALTVSVYEFMEQLNAYYLTHVKPEAQ